MYSSCEGFSLREEKQNWGKGWDLIVKQMCPGWKWCLSSAHSCSKVVFSSPAHTFQSWLHIEFFFSGIGEQSLWIWQSYNDALKD